MSELIRQETLRRVQAGGSLYGELVGHLRKSVDAGGRIEDGPLAVDFKALRSNAALPVRIIISMSELPVAGDVGGGFDKGPLRNIQSFVSLLDQTAGPASRRDTFKKYSELLYRYRIQTKLILRNRRRMLTRGMSRQLAGDLLLEAMAFQVTTLRFRVAGILYVCGLPGSLALSRAALCSVATD